MTADANWYDANSTRPFPLDDAASGVDDTGVEMPDDVLVDLSVGWAVDDPRVPFVSAVTAGDGTASVTVSAAVVGGPAEVIAVFTAGPVTADTAVGLAAVGDSGAAGRVAFGSAVSRPTASYRFSDPTQSRVAARCLRLYRQSGITAVRRADAAGRLTGLLTVAAGSDLLVSVGTRTVQGTQVTGVIFSLADSTVAVDLFQRYAGQCGGRPESGTCLTPPVEYLQTVHPDCDGNINLVFATPFRYTTDPGVITVGLDVTLGDVCVDRLPDADGNLPGFPYDPYNPVDGDPYSPPPPAVPPPPTDVSSSSIDCSTLPFCGQVGEGLWQVIAGTWQTDVGSFPHCPDVGSSSSSTGSAAADPYYVCYSTDVRAVMVWYDCAYADALNLRAETAVRIDGSGQAGVCLGYAFSESAGADVYLAVQLDQPSNRLRIRRWTGLGYVTLLSSGALAIPTGAWYRVWAQAVGGPTGPVVITAGVGPADGPDLVTMNTSTTSFVRDGGRVGVISEQAPAGFGYFAVREA